MSALTAIHPIILPATAGCRGAPWCSRCQFAQNPTDRCCLECDSRTKHSQEAAIRSHVSKQLSEKTTMPSQDSRFVLKATVQVCFCSFEQDEWLDEIHRFAPPWMQVVHEELVLAVKWSLSAGMTVYLIGSLSLILSSFPRRAKAPHLLRLQRHLFSLLPTWLCFPGGCVFPFESQPNRLLMPSWRLIWVGGIQRRKRRALPASQENKREFTLAFNQIHIKVICHWIAE